MQFWNSLPWGGVLFQTQNLAQESCKQSFFRYHTVLPIWQKMSHLMAGAFFFLWNHFCGDRQKQKKQNTRAFRSNLRRSRRLLSKLRTEMFNTDKCLFTWRDLDVIRHRQASPGHILLCPEKAVWNTVYLKNENRSPLNMYFASPQTWRPGYGPEVSESGERSTSWLVSGTYNRVQEQIWSNTILIGTVFTALCSISIN